MTLNRLALRELAEDAIAIRTRGSYQEAIAKLHALQREITPEMMIELLDDSERVRPEPESIHPPPPTSESEINRLILRGEIACTPEMYERAKRWEMDQ